MLSSLAFRCIGVISMPDISCKSINDLDMAICEPMLGRLKLRR